MRPMMAVLGLPFAEPDPEHKKAGIGSTVIIVAVTSTPMGAPLVTYVDEYGSIHNDSAVGAFRVDGWADSHQPGQPF